MPPASGDPAAVDTINWERLRAGGDSGIWVMRMAAHGETGLHDHLFHELAYVESGSAEHITAEGTQRLRPGDLIVIRPQVWHAYRQTRNLTIINCLFEKRVLQQLSPFLERVEGAFELFRRPSRRARREAPTVLHLRPAQRPALLERMHRILAEQQQRGNGWQAAAAAALLEVLIATARLSRQQLSDQPLRLADRTGQAVLDTATYLEANYTMRLSLAELSARVGLSPAHLSRHFSRRMGMGIVEFIHQLRCEEACRLLRLSDQAIGRVASRVGYDEIAYFSRCFRKQVGQSPRQYCHSYRGTGASDARR